MRLKSDHEARPSLDWKYHSWLVLWYIVTGLLHEMAHVAVAVWFMRNDSSASSINQETFSARFLFDLFLGRRFVLDAMLDGDQERWIRHAGWIISVGIALFVNGCISRHFVGTQQQKGSKNTSSGTLSTLVSTLQYAAWITALEGLWTDLFHLPAIPAILGTGSSPTGTLVFCCGNFGMILLHHAWWTKSSESAMDIMEKMVQVTMMRGAQSGGVITFHPKRHSEGQSKLCRQELKGIRTRVVNRKRTDLSVKLRRKVQHDNFRFGKTPFPKDHVPVFAGHTRFATSSKATMEGTHPQQWSPAAPRRVYNFDVIRTCTVVDESVNSRASSAQPGHSNPAIVAPQVIQVDNYITHNGDFDFYNLNGKSYDLGAIQKWLAVVLQYPMPAPVDSCAVAGMVDLLRCQGCFGLSLRYALAMGLPTAVIFQDQTSTDFPQYGDFESIGKVFEDVLGKMIAMGAVSLSSMGNSSSDRESFASKVVGELKEERDLLEPLAGHLGTQGGHVEKTPDEVEAGHVSTLHLLCLSAVNAFYDNDLMFVTKEFLAKASGSFGLCVTSSLDAHRQVCLAARGQTMSIAFYPRKGMILYGSEQAAVKAGLKVPFPGNAIDELDHSLGDVDNDALRLDLDDLGGEVVLLDWGGKRFANPPVSSPNRHLANHQLMNGAVTAHMHQESKATTMDRQLYHRMIRLTRNQFVKPLQDDTKDLIEKDIKDIPKVCERIQEDWHSRQVSSSLNRLAAHTLGRCLRERLEARVNGTLSTRAVDILVTGVEVSLWVGEQFASDLQKSFPKLRTLAVSSNKLLGLYGQDISVPCVGFPYSSTSHDLQDAIVIIVSHSGGTFAPLSCSNLLQSTTQNIFVVTSASEYETQVGKQLLSMDMMDGDEDCLFRSRIFSTEVGVRTAEPCSLTVVATHQILTNLFEYISALILSDVRFRHAVKATISEQDLQIIERCNRENIEALEEIVGATRFGNRIESKGFVENELRATGKLWADHVLENARAYIMSFLYIFTTVISGWPLFYSIARGIGMDQSSDWVYAAQTLDAALYFWLPQVNIIVLRILQRRSLLHRMVGRTVVIGDIPWVAQCAEAFLSKIFAVSYSIAGLNVLSGNPADHFVHRHTHRVVRGSLIICGRPDGRLSALASAEATVSLSVNQASSIQSLGATCESITIGTPQHNPFALPLTMKGIFLKRKRPLFFCERLVLESDVAEDQKHQNLGNRQQPSGTWTTPVAFLRSMIKRESVANEHHDLSLSRNRDSSVRPRFHRRRSAAALLGTFRNFDELEANVIESDGGEEMGANTDQELSVNVVVEEAIEAKKWSDHSRKLFGSFDLDQNGLLSEQRFVEGAQRLQPGLSEEELRAMFHATDSDDSGTLDYNQFLKLLQSTNWGSGIKLPASHRDERGLIQVEPSRERYFGEQLRKHNAGKSVSKHVDYAVARSQTHAMVLYESRIASIQRFVSMIVIFHEMGKQVESFFDRISLGLLAYRMDRTHSIMRIATTASPVSGADVRQRMRHLHLLKKVQRSIHIISTAYLRYKQQRQVHSLAKKLSSIGEGGMADEQPTPAL
eukprot:CAMPEP_0168849630 /NCGR_PEP_ID=MMETSP0727-20121128/11463_1 /TAXON_ID=265536 /ORGANISM="Amphiprora sp., Strain CCMP467" /LENGTH=1558 /DNA_ID=CAMNT_0008903533 /DNA_START=441 /DNA_END=5117 /DNA_ORIENTATION=+